MDINKILEADYLDIIFDGRNKAYGSYDLRRKYARRSRRAGTLVIAAAIVLSAIPTLATILSDQPVNTVAKVTPVIVLPAPVLPDPKVVPPPPPPPAASAYTPPPSLAMADPEVAPDNEVTKPLPTQDELRDHVVSTIDADGPGDPRLEGRPSESGLAGGRGAEVETKRPEPVKYVDQMPQFSGDINEWLSAKLRYPESAREKGQEGLSYVEFVVNEDGSIEAAQIVRGSFAALDAEALRVVNAMPKWKPGRLNGTPVRVYFKIPITFKLD